MSTLSPYAEELALARLDALRELIDAMTAAEDPAEKRRCAVAIFNAPDPCDIDDSVELEDDEETDEESNDEAEGESDEEVDGDVKETTGAGSDDATDATATGHDNTDADEELASRPAPIPPRPAPPSHPTSDIAHPTSHIPPPS
jgi:hypothetical protein